MTDLVPYQPPAELAVPDQRDTDSWIGVCSDVIKVANVINDTPFVPDGLRGSAPAVAAAILAGRELGIGPMTALQHIHVIKGKPAQSAALMRALIQAAGHHFETVEITDTRAVVRGKRRGEAAWEEASFTADQARKANIQLGGYPQDKLYARATSRLARRKFADVIAGMPYSAEELEDGAEGDAPPPAPAAAPTEKPKTRTAQRKTRQRAEFAPEPEPESVAATEPAMPPLPGEDEPEPAPEPVTNRQLTAIWTVLSDVFQFGSDEKDAARAVCAHIIGRPLASTREMGKDDAGTVLDTLGMWQELAEKEGMTPRDMLTELMVTATGDAPEAGDG